MVIRSMTQKSEKTRGIIYIVVGKRYLQRAEISAYSLKKIMPDLPITLFSSNKASSPYFDNVILINEEIENSSFRSPKIPYFLRSPYDYTLFLDADTYICSEFYELFNLLNYFDIAVAHDTFRLHTMNDAALGDIIRQIPESYPMFNTGVILFRNSTSIKSLFEKWLLTFEDNCDLIRNSGGNYFGDQTAFREAIYSSDVRIATLAPEYNCRFNHPVFLNSKVKILHGVNRNMIAVEHEMNSKDGNRVFLPSLGIIHESRQSPFQFTKWYISRIKDSWILRIRRTMANHSINLFPRWKD
jgi:hypothetical protein